MNGHYDVKQWYSELEIESALLPNMLLREPEDNYNKRIGSMPGYYLFHGKPVHLPANRGPIEFCDLAMQRQLWWDLIHVKRYGYSSKLSHLFLQGMNSAKLMRTSPEFRKALSDSIVKYDEALARRFSIEPSRSDYRVVFAIASSSIGRLELPLFSKLSLRQATRELEGLGFQYCLTKIVVPAEERVVRVKKSKKVNKTF